MKKYKSGRILRRVESRRTDHAHNFKQKGKFISFGKIFFFVSVIIYATVTVNELNGWSKSAGWVSIRNSNDDDVLGCAVVRRRDEPLG